MPLFAERLSGARATSACIKFERLMKSWLRQRDKEPNVLTDRETRGKNAAK